MINLSITMINALRALLHNLPGIMSQEIADYSKYYLIKYIRPNTQQALLDKGLIEWLDNRLCPTELGLSQLSEQDTAWVDREALTALKAHCVEAGVSVRPEPVISAVRPEPVEGLGASTSSARTEESSVQREAWGGSFFEAFAKAWGSEELGVRPEPVEELGASTSSARTVAGSVQTVAGEAQTTTPAKRPVSNPCTDVLSIEYITQKRAERKEASRLRLEHRLQQHPLQTSEHPLTDLPVNLENPEPLILDAETTASIKHQELPIDDPQLAELYRLVREYSPLLFGFRFVPPLSPKLKAIEAQIIRAEAQQTIDQLRGNTMPTENHNDTVSFDIAISERAPLGVRPGQVEAVRASTAHRSTSSGRTVVRTAARIDMDALVSAIRFSGYFHYETWIDDRMLLDVIDNRASTVPYLVEPKRFIWLSFSQQAVPVEGSDVDYMAWAKSLTSIQTVANRKNWYRAYSTARILSRHGEGILPPSVINFSEVE